jgi:hypothetical protein
MVIMMIMVVMVRMMLINEYIIDIPPIFIQTYCTQWLPDGQIIAGGSDMNMLRMLEQSSTSTVVRLMIYHSIYKLS